MQGDAPDERAALRLRIAELTSGLLELVAVNTAGGADNEDNDAQYASLSEEIQTIQARLDEIDATRQENEKAVARIDDILAAAAEMKYLAMAFDGKIVRQMISCVKVITREKLLVIFKSGLEREVAIV